MKPKDIREKNDTELAELNRDLRQQLWKAGFDNHANLLDDTDKLRRLRRDIARVETIVRERAKAEAR